MPTTMMMTFLGWLWDGFYIVALLALLLAAWYGMWVLFLSKVPVLAHLKAVLLGEKSLPPRGKKQGVVFRASSRQREGPAVATA